MTNFDGNFSFNSSGFMKQYNTNIFEFVSNEHTRKNVMLVGTKSNKKPDTKLISEKIEAIKEDYNIEYHFLEKILDV